MDFLGDLIDLISYAADPIVSIVARNIAAVAQANVLTDFGKSVAIAIVNEEKHPSKGQVASYIVFHHYTDRKSAEKIKDSRKIKQSTDVTAAFGEGVYGTALGPENGRENLARNNYGGLWRTREDDGKLECVVRLKLRKNKNVKKVKSDREIYLYNGDLGLDEAEEVDFIYYDHQKRKTIEKWK